MHERVASGLRHARVVGAKSLGTREAKGLFREILARNSGSHDQDMALGTPCHKNCDTARTPTHSLTSTREGDANPHPTKLSSMGS